MQQIESDNNITITIIKCMYAAYLLIRTCGYETIYRLACRTNLSFPTLPSSSHSFIKYPRSNLFSCDFNNDSSLRVDSYRVLINR